MSAPDELNRHEKRTLYRLGLYRMEVPPVNTDRWDEDAWIHWIDTRGEWLGSNGGDKS